MVVMVVIGADYCTLRLVRSGSSGPRHPGYDRKCRTQEGGRRGIMDFEFGLLYSFRDPPQWSVGWKQCYDDHLAHIVEMEQAGFDTIWLTEHHFSEDGYLPSLAVMSAAIAMRTSRVCIGQAIIELPLHHPVALAEDLAVADILSGGRLRVGIGLGRMNDWRPSFAHEGLVFGAPLNGKGARPGVPGVHRYSAEVLGQRSIPAYRSALPVPRDRRHPQTTPNQRAARMVWGRGPERPGRWTGPPASVTAGSAAPAG